MGRGQRAEKEQEGQEAGVGIGGREVEGVEGELRR